MAACTEDTMPTMPAKPLSRREAASFIGVEYQTLGKWAITGKGPKFFKLHNKLEASH